MKHIIKKWIVVFLVIAMIGAVLPLNSVQAADQTEGGLPLNYIYINESYIEPGNEQSIVVSWGEETETVKKMELLVENENGEQTVIEPANMEDHIYLFEHIFEKGIYHIAGLRVGTDEDVEEYTYEDLEINAYFGVGKEYTGDEKSEYIEMESASEEVPEVETSIVTLDEDGTATAQNSISNALEEAASHKMKKAGRMASGTQNVVVVLDPGHDSTHAGASGNGVKEEVTTLKIAQYCKAELEKYGGVNVYLTRETAACPYPKSGNNIADIKERVKWANGKGADVFVSIHLNALEGTSAKGAEVYYPKSSATGKDLAQKIQNELVAVGLYNRGVKGDASYTVVNTSMSYGFPGLIIEHAFVSNSSDASKYLTTESGLKKLGIADAGGIAKYFDLKKIGDPVTVSEGTYVIESALQSGKVVGITDSSMSNTAALTLSDNNNCSAQRFEVSNAGGGYYTIAAEHSGKVLDIKSGSSVPGTPIQQYQSNNSSAQKWRFISAGDGCYYLQSSLGTYMDVKSANVSNGTQIDAYTFNGSTAQKWKLIDSNYRPVEDGTYNISNKAGNNQMIDVAATSMNNGANVQIYNNNNSSAQRFEVTYVGNGYYKIIAEHSGKALDVVSGSKSNGTNLQQYAWTGAKAQLWKFVEAGNGYYYLRSKCGTVVDLASKDAVPGTNAYMWEMTDSDSQKWRFTKSEYQPIKDGNYVISSKAAEYQAMTEKGGNIQLETYDNSSEQKCQITYVGDGYYKIVLNSTGKALDVASGSSKAGANVHTYNWNGTSAQLWKFVNAGGGSYYIKSRLGTILDVTGGKTQSGTNIQMYTMNGTVAQKWVLDSEKVVMPERPFEDGTYMIQNGTNTTQVLDLKSASESNGGNIQTYTSNKTSAQRFELFYVRDGYYRIMSERSGKALDIKGGSVIPGANVQQYTWNATEAQLWKFISAGDGKYYIKSKKGTVLDLNKSSAASGVNVQTDTMKGENSQKWKIVEDVYHPLTDGTYSFRVSASKNQVLDIKSASLSDKANAWLYTYNGSDAQKFDVAYVDKGYYKIVSKNSGKALEYDKTMSGNSANVRQNEWTGSDEQLWKFILAPSGGYYIKSKNGKVLDVYAGKLAAGSNVQLYVMNGTAAQKWTARLEKDYKGVDIAEGIYTIQTSLNKGYVLDVAGGSTANGGNIQLYSGNDSEAQKFRVTKAAGEYYKITSVKSGKALDISGGSMISGSNVQQYTWNNSSAQLWRFIDTGDGEYYIQSKLGTVLDVKNGKAAKGINVQTYVMNGTAAQKWNLTDN